MIQAEIAERQDELVNRARAAMAQAYAPYSKFHVGAALLFAEDGRPFVLRPAPTMTNDRILPTSLAAHGTAPPELTLLPCGHRCLCLACAGLWGPAKCPSCHAPVSEMI